MRQELIDVLKVRDYIAKRRDDYDRVVWEGGQRPENDEYFKGKVEAYDDVLQKLDQLANSIKVSAEKWNDTVSKLTSR